MGHGKLPLDYGMAEALAFGSLAMQGTPIRLSGQDSRRGTFNHRHSVLIDIEDEQRIRSALPSGAGAGAVEIYNSELVGSRACWVLSTATAATIPRRW